MDKSNLSGIKLNGSTAIVADGSVLMCLRYKGSEASATVTVASGDITLKHGAAAAEAADTTVGASGVVADGTYTTLGAVVDAINLSPNWEAWLVDGLRADTSTNAFKALSEYTFSPKSQVVSLYADTSVTLSLTFAISAKRDNAFREQKGKRSVFEQARALVNVGSGTLTLTIYDVTPDRGTTKTLATFVGTDNTELSALIAGGVGELLSDYGHDLLVRYVGSVDLPDSGAYMNVAGHVET